MREAWREGPPATNVDAMLASLRPALVRIDAELEGAPAGFLESLRRFVTLPFAGALATGAAAALLLVFLLSPQTTSNSSYELAELTPTGDPTVVEQATPAPNVDDPDSHLAGAPAFDPETNAPVLMFENEDSTLIWVVEGQDDISFVSWNRAG